MVMTLKLYLTLWVFKLISAILRKRKPYLAETPSACITVTNWLLLFDEINSCCFDHYTRHVYLCNVWMIWRYVNIKVRVLTVTTYFALHGETQKNGLPFKGNFHSITFKVWCTTNDNENANSTQLSVCLPSISLPNGFSVTDAWRWDCC